MKVLAWRFDSSSVVGIQTYRDDEINATCVQLNALRPLFDPTTNEEEAALDSVMRQKLDRIAYFKNGGFISLTNHTLQI